MNPVDRSGSAAPRDQFRATAVLADPDPDRATEMPASDGWTPVLTPRQEQILSLISAGMTNREIGAELGVAEKTVKNSVTGLLACLGLQRRSQAAVYGAMRRMTAMH